MHEFEPSLILLDPPYRNYYADRLFDASDRSLNRDGTLLPFCRLREHAWAAGREMHTADRAMHTRGRQIAYYSLGGLDAATRLNSVATVRYAAALIMEPPVVAPSLYTALPRLTAQFDRVYVHNVHGMGYSMKGLDTRKLHKLYFPIPYDDVLEPYWSSQDRRENRIVVINGNHNPRFRAGEQYSTRVEAMAQLARHGVVDLYGFGWDKWWSPKAMWRPYWRHRSTLMSIYKGSCTSKFEVLCRYRFCLCFENMAMDGFITEKLFDCLYAGTIPLYLGAPDIAQYVPKDVYIDCRQFSSWAEMCEYIRGLPKQNIDSMRVAGRDFLHSELGKKFYNALDDIILSTH